MCGVSFFSFLILVIIDYCLLMEMYLVRSLLIRPLVCIQVTPGNLDYVAQSIYDAVTNQTPCLYIGDPWKPGLCCTIYS